MTIPIAASPSSRAAQLAGGDVLPASLTLAQTIAVFARGDRLAVRLYATPAEAREAGERAMRDGTADSVGQGRFYQISSQPKPPAGEPNA